MITRLSASIIGLLAFAGCILMGLAVGNPFETIILRALGGLVGGMIVGWFAGYMGQTIVQENFRQVVEEDILAEAAAKEAARQAEADAMEAEEIEQSVQTDGNPSMDGAEVTEEVATGDRMEEDEASEEQSLSARAARELMTNVR